LSLKKQFIQVENQISGNLFQMLNGKNHPAPQKAKLCSTRFWKQTKRFTPVITVYYEDQKNKLPICKPGCPLFSDNEDL